MTIGIYERVSSTTQDHAAQHADLDRWGNGQVEPVDYYKDKATGKTMDRPAWQRLWADVCAGKITTIVVWRIDRLGRTVSGLADLFAELQARKVNLVSLRDCLDLSTPSGRLMAHVLASVAAYETEVRSERQLAGIAVALDDVKAGRRKGWGGRAKGQRYKVKEETISAVKKMKGDGESIAAIARLLKLSRPTIYAILGD